MKSKTKQHHEITIEYNTLAIPLTPPPSKLTFLYMSWEVDFENKTFLSCIPCHSPILSQRVLLDVPHEGLMFNIKCTYLKIFNAISDFDLEWYNEVKMQYKHNIAIATYSRITIQTCFLFLVSICSLSWCWASPVTSREYITHALFFHASTREGASRDRLPIMSKLCSDTVKRRPSGKQFYLLHPKLCNTKHARVTKVGRWTAFRLQKSPKT